jgi:hypothetical protein
MLEKQSREDVMKASIPARPISWPVCVTVFFLSSV